MGPSQACGKDLDLSSKAPFEVTLYASDDCTGASSVATASSGLVFCCESMGG